MRAALLSEFRKFFSTRLWWVLLLCAAGYMAFLAGIFGFALTMAAQDAAEMGIEAGMSAEELAQTIYGLSATVGYVFPVIVGALAVTSEFRHKTITPTLLAEPRRTVVLGAKLLGAAPLGLLFGLVGTAVTVGVGGGLLALRGSETYLGDPVVTRAVLLSVLAGVLWAVVGVGLGAALPNQVLAIVVLLVFTQFVEPMVRMLASLVEWGPTVAQFLPGAAGDALVGASVYGSMTPGESSALLEWWQGGLVLLALALLLAGIGRATTFRKDIT